MRTILKSKKGISPILATLLLIVIAVAAVIVTYAWVMTFTSSTTSQAGALLTVENVRFYGSGEDDIEIIIRNSGTANAKIAEVYQGPSTSELQKMSVRSYEPDTQIVSEGSSILIRIRLDAPWESGTRYHFKVVTEEGFSLPFSAEAP